MTTDVLRASLNAGEVSRHALARVDLAKLKVATEVTRNFIPHVLGPAQFRPGTRYIADVPGHAIGWLGEFAFSETDTALLVMVPGGLFFLVGDQYVTRPTVTALIANGDFGVDLAGWTDSDEAGAVSSWSAGYMSLLGTGTNFAQRDQLVAAPQPGIEHGLRISVARNEVDIKVGTTQGADDYLAATLGPGSYSLAFTPTGAFWIRLAANSEYPALVDLIAVEPAGPVAIPVPYTTKAHFDALRYDQSEDVLFVANHLFQQRRIERRSADSRSWGVALYQAPDGPFRLGNISSTTLAASATTGTAVLTASRPLFKPGHAGALFRLTHSTQRRSTTLAALNDATGEIRVAGLTTHAATSSSPGTVTQRAFTVDVTMDGSWSGTVTLQRSLAEPGLWADVESYTATTSKTYDDGLDNQIIYYRLTSTAYSSGSALAVLGYAGSAQNGIVRITSVVSTVSATADVLTQLGETEPTSDWAEGEWSDHRGWPAGVAIHDGRLCWFPGIKAQMSISDAYASFDDTVEGDSGPINRKITTGGADGVRWALSLQRLLAGTAMQVVSIRSNAFDEPLTPTALTARACADDGVVGTVRPVRAQGAGIYAGAANRLFKLTMPAGSGDYDSTPIDRLKPEMYQAGIVDMAVMRKPDNAHHFSCMADGTIVLLAYNEKEQVEALCSWDTDGACERTACLPSSANDSLYFMVKRTILGVEKRYIEKLAMLSESRGGTISKTVDSHIVYSGAPTQSIAAPHLAGKFVRLWADGVPFSVEIPLDISGNGIIPVPVSNFVVGLAYEGKIKTAKLAEAAEHGTALTLKKRVSRVGLVMSDVAWKGIRIGRDFDRMTGLPATYRGRVLDPSEMFQAYDAFPIAVNGGWDNDSRLCIKVSSPYCATIDALVLHMETNEPVMHGAAVQTEEAGA
jgi:hypothetical protein